MPIAHDHTTTKRVSSIPPLISIVLPIWLLCMVCVSSVDAQPTAPTSIAEPASPIPTPIPATPSAHETGTLLMHNALRRAVWGPSVTCKIRQRTSLFDKQLVTFGTYAHAGQGSGQLKMHVRLATDERINTLIQVSDGRVMYSTQHIGDVSVRSRVDLYRIREYLGPIDTASLEDPVIAMYLAVGGQAELLRKLVQQYKWTHVRAGKLDEIDVWWLSGELATEQPAVRALAKVDQPSTQVCYLQKCELRSAKGSLSRFGFIKSNKLARKASLASKTKPV